MPSKKTHTAIDQHYAAGDEIQKDAEQNGAGAHNFAEGMIRGDVDAVPEKANADKNKRKRKKKTRRAIKWAALTVAGAAAVAAGIQAFYADRQVKVSRDIGMRQTRAYAIVEPSGRPHILPGQRAVEHLNVSVFGQTPAYRMHHVAKIEINSIPLTPRKLLGAFPEKTPYYITLAPGKKVSFEAESDTPLPSDFIEKAKAGKSQGIFVYGSVWYDDVFGASRCEMFCFVYMIGNDGAIGRSAYCNSKWEGQEEAEQSCSQ